jgi:predicted RNase H-like nuclease (RuvC/YqgF family)
MQDKHAQAQKALDDFLAANAPNEQTDNSDDPVAAAIERAKAKRAAGPEDVSEESLQKAVDAARKRLLTTQEKVAAAKEDNPDLAATLETSLAKMQQKVEKAEADLAQFKAEQS